MNPFRENFELRWSATALGWRIALIGSIAGLVACFGTAPLAHPPPALAAMRLLFFAAAIVAMVVNKRVADDFYARVYAEASVMSLIASSVVFFARSQYAFSGDLPSGAAVLVLVATWGCGFFIAFMRLRTA